MSHIFYHIHSAADDHLFPGIASDLQMTAGYTDLPASYFYPDQGVCILKDPFKVYNAEIRSACYSQDRDAWLYFLWDSGPVHDLMFKIGFFLAHVPRRFTRNYY